MYKNASLILYGIFILKRQLSSHFQYLSQLKYNCICNQDIHHVSKTMVQGYPCEKNTDMLASYSRLYNLQNHILTNKWSKYQFSVKSPILDCIDCSIHPETATWPLADHRQKYKIHQQKNRYDCWWWTATYLDLLLKSILIHPSPQQYILHDQIVDYPHLRVQFESPLHVCLMLPNLFAGNWIISRLGNVSLCTNSIIHRRLGFHCCRPWCSLSSISRI